jgi:hypothetical protein
MELLTSEILDLLGNEGYEMVSMGLAPLAMLDDPDLLDHPLVAWLMRLSTNGPVEVTISSTCIATKLSTTLTHGSHDISASISEGLQSECSMRLFAFAMPLRWMVFRSSKFQGKSENMETRCLIHRWTLFSVAFVVLAATTTTVVTATTGAQSEC